MSLKYFPRSVFSLERLTQLEEAISIYDQHGSEKLVRAAAIVDATDDVATGRLAGAECDIPTDELLQNATLIFMLLELIVLIRLVAHDFEWFFDRLSRSIIFMVLITGRES